MNCSDITFCDGYGIKMLSYLFCKRCLKNRNTPTDFVDLVYQQIYNFGSKVYFLGGTERSIQRYSAKIDIYFPGIIAGYHHGFYDENELHQVIEKINDSKPLLLLVGMGMPKQEKFVYQNIQNLNISNILTVGDLFSWRYDSWRGRPRKFFSVKVADDFF
jgi:N-acetylglucosaminyldiphosphoundecaprenol N-acetyl-beta-D-mannosaminyltransferase